MRITTRPAAALLCAGGLALTVPNVAAAAEPDGPVVTPTQCLIGVRRVEVTCHRLPFRTLYTVRTRWLPFATTSGGPCAKSNPV